MSDPQQFYEQRIPSQFNRAFEAQQAQAQQADASAADTRLFEGMSTMDTTLCVVVEGDSGGRFYLNIDGGRMSCATAATHPLCLTLIQDLAAFEVLERESGDSALGFLGGLAGLAGEFHLTADRVAALGELAGCLRFELEGADGFSLLTHFGQGEVPAEPNAGIRVKASAYERLRSGELSPPEAFMSGAVDIDGDMQLAMQIALALLASE